MNVDGFGRYARAECERRFLIGSMPAGFALTWRIRDRYIDGTRMRLRAATDSDGEVIYKFAQKIRPDDRDPSIVMLTNLYLSSDEYMLLDRLAGPTLEKSRHRAGGSVVAVDVFAGRLDGLLLAEASFGSVAEMNVFEPPAWLDREVTADDRYSGGALARDGRPA